jgi:hypothetical protein
MGERRRREKGKSLKGVDRVRAQKGESQHAGAYKKRSASRFQLGLEKRRRRRRRTDPEAGNIRRIEAAGAN